MSRAPRGLVGCMTAGLLFYGLLLLPGVFGKDLCGVLGADLNVWHDGEQWHAEALDRWSTAGGSSTPSGEPVWTLRLRIFERPSTLAIGAARSADIYLRHVFIFDLQGGEFLPELSTPAFEDALLLAEIQAALAPILADAGYGAPRLDPADSLVLVAKPARFVYGIDPLAVIQLFMVGVVFTIIWLCWFRPFGNAGRDGDHAVNVDS